MSLSVAIRHARPGFTLDAAFEAPSGVTALFGQSGAGKTTVVQAVAGLLRPDSGRIAVQGEVLCDTAAGVWRPPHKRRVGYVFQEDRLLPHLSVAQNLRYGAWFVGGTDRAAEEKVVEMLGIAALLKRRPSSLSGGEKQRVAIGRALLSRPRLLLLDEPLAALDDARKGEILPYLERLRDETEIPILYVSHALSEVARLATTVVVLEAGRVTRTGPAAGMLADPAAMPSLGPRVAGAVLDGRVVAQHCDGLTELAISAGALFLPRVEAAVGETIRVRIAAQDVILAREEPAGLSALNILPATVTAMRDGLGPGTAVQLKVGEDLILSRVTRRSARALGLHPGASCFAVIKTVSVARADIGRGAAGT